ncbi:MAG TPA: hypothetical protein VGG92_01965 [Caulobacteraceae bacterium]
MTQRTLSKCAWAGLTGAALLLTGPLAQAQVVASAQGDSTSDGAASGASDTAASDSPAAGTDQSGPAPSNIQVPAPAPGPCNSFFSCWKARSDAAKASQPHWITPLATVTPRLEQEYRFDALGENMGNGAHLNNYDGGKGIELIPDETNEVLINLPPYEVRSRKKVAEGFGDWGFLTVKQRFLSANEENGNYIVTGFFGVSAPTGVTAFTQNAWVVTPTLAAGKGWGAFDIQATVGVPIPLSNVHEIGVQIVNNVTFQLHVDQYFWPEVEFNTTHWTSGPRSGKTQLFFTPGIVIGRLPLTKNNNLIIGVGYQTALTPKVVLTPALTPTYSNAWLVSSRVTF